MSTEHLLLSLHVAIDLPVDLHVQCNAVSYSNSVGGFVSTFDSIAHEPDPHVQEAIVRHRAVAAYSAQSH